MKLNLFKGDASEYKFDSSLIKFIEKKNIQQKKVAKFHHASTDDVTSGNMLLLSYPSTNKTWEDYFLLTVCDFYARWQVMQKKVGMVCAKYDVPFYKFKRTYTTANLMDYGMFANSPIDTSCSSLPTNSEFRVIGDSFFYFNLMPYSIGKNFRHVHPTVFLYGSKSEKTVFKSSIHILGVDSSRIQVDPSSQENDCGDFFVPECGADALRLSLLECCGNNVLNDVVILRNKIFIDKFYSVFQSIFIKDCEEEFDANMINMCSAFVLREFNIFLERVNKYIDSFDYRNYVLSIKSFLDRYFYPYFRVLDPCVIQIIGQSLIKCLTPAAPFVTSFLWDLADRDTRLHEETFPSSNSNYFFEERVKFFDSARDVAVFFKKIRGMYSLMKNPSSILVYSDDDDTSKMLIDCEGILATTFNIDVKLELLKEKSIGVEYAEYELPLIPIRLLILISQENVNLKRYSGMIQNKIMRIGSVFKKKRYEQIFLEKLTIHERSLQETIKSIEVNGKISIAKEEEHRKFDMKSCLKKRNVDQVDSKKKKGFRLKELNHLTVGTESKEIIWLEKKTTDMIDNIEKGPIVIATYNVLFDVNDCYPQFESVLNNNSRFKLQMAMLKGMNLDIILLNEVTNKYEKLMKSSEWIIKGYDIISFRSGNNMFNSILISRRMKGVKFYSVKFSELSNTLCCFLHINSHLMCFTVSHFKARRRMAFLRRRQFEILSQEMTKICLERGVDVWLCCGDFNLHSDLEKDLLFKKIQFVDVRKVTKSSTPEVMTFDSTTNNLLQAMYGPDYKKKENFDRILFKDFTLKGGFKTLNVEVFGDENLLDGQFPLSDHFGLVCKFKVD